MKKVLVTGADGFIGSHLAEALVKKGFHVRALALYNSFNSWGWLDDSPYQKDMEIITGDVRDPFLCNTITKDIDTVFHLAALIAIPYSYVAPQAYVETNISGTLNICQAAKENNCARIIQTSTSEVYGTAQFVPINETHPMRPQSPYSATKIASDNIALSYYYAFNSPVVIARPFNTYGPRQSARAVIPTIISQILSGQNKINLGDLRPTRDFNFVSDTCDGLIGIAEADLDIVQGQSFNICSGNEISILELVNKIKKLMNSQIQIEEVNERVRPADSEVFRLLGDYSKLKKATNYSSKIDFESGLVDTINWFCNSENLKKYKTGIYNV